MTESLDALMAASPLSGAVFSPCRRWRYLLWRNWNPGELDTPDLWLLCIGLNPSKADEKRNDPTVSQMCGRGRRLGCTGLLMCNTAAYVSTDPAGMRDTADPCGPENLAYIAAAVERADMIIAAWGNLAGERGWDVERILRESGKPAHVLGLTRSMNPRHPRGVSLETQPRLWIAGTR